MTNGFGCNGYRASAEPIVQSDGEHFMPAASGAFVLGTKTDSYTYGTCLLPTCTYTRLQAKAWPIGICRYFSFSMWF